MIVCLCMCVHFIYKLSSTYIFRERGSLLIHWNITVIFTFFSALNLLYDIGSYSIQQAASYSWPLFDWFNFINSIINIYKNYL